MPTYEYKCRSCSHQFEQFQSMTAAPIRKCSSCGKNTVQRLIGTGAAIMFKGSGFYQTDYRSESYKKAAEADSKAASASPAVPAAESKPAAPAPTTPPAAEPKPAKREKTAKAPRPAKD